jgi:hypothetical protein
MLFRPASDRALSNRYGFHNSPFAYCAALDREPGLQSAST